MISPASFLGRLKGYKSHVVTVYPIAIILIIPMLLVVNTYWNLKSFNRDANFIVRHQALSIANSIKPQLESYSGSEDVGKLLTKITTSNEDLLSISIFKKSGDIFNFYASSIDKERAKIVGDSSLNHLAVGFNESFAALSYSPELQRNIWTVVVPYEKDQEFYLLNFQMDSKSVSDILTRTSRDSFVVLVVLVIFTLILLANHFYFYLRALKTKQLEELDKLKDEFISMAAHELRAPITGITGYLDLLKGEILKGNTRSQAEDVDILTTLTKDLNGLVEDLLDVSRIEQGRLKVEAAEVSISEVIQKVIVVMTPVAKQKNLELQFNTPQPQIVKTDPERLRQVVTNLVSNSIKYTLKGSVNIDLKQDEKFAKITIKDTGVGIPPEEVKKLFGKFHRVKDRQTSEVRGTGLGLWITKQVVELLGGTIEVESIYGTGSSFSFTIPVTA